MACWYGLYFLFQAVLIPVICLRNDPQCALATSWRDQISQAIHVLESMTQLNTTASRCPGVIPSLCGSYFDPSVDRWGPTEVTANATGESIPIDVANIGNGSFRRYGFGNESTILDLMNQLPGFE
ncbi:hypothetical protein PENANT_c065G00446 [Penicillium antarcticum]|uniref:Uncharacterized protein n=1 Tax=Penicillium antarcticum TaxID=416450 RepID=A0A1V6PPQ3_9EURO|nr:hypothetical protein PENANT_c065G00446 [Penicillium antarcticum]